MSERDQIVTWLCNAARGYIAVGEFKVASTLMAAAINIRDGWHARCLSTSAEVDNGTTRTWTYGLFGGGPDPDGGGLPN
jgi:hypothetical protein